VTVKGVVIGIREALVLLSIAIISGTDRPPDVPGVDTVMLARPEALISDAITASVNWVALTNVVVLDVPFHNTVEPEVNPLPFTVKTIPVDPATITAGVRLLSIGPPDTGAAATVTVTAAALLVGVAALASVTVKLKLSDPAKPAVGV
jgi:hypothetical protein